jgi:hypothetical protein
MVRTIALPELALFDDSHHSSSQPVVLPVFLLAATRQFVERP